jgi:hypothetical protein
VPTPVARLAAGIAAAAALAGCGGGGERHAPAAPASVHSAVDLVPLTTAQATTKARRVALVVANGSDVIEGAPGTPFTRTRFTVERMLKGRLPHDFAIQVIGGRLGAVTVPSPVQAFVPAHRYVLFLGPDGPHGPTIFPQSVMEVR